MQIPSDVELLCRSFFQGVTDLYDSTSEMIKHAVSDLAPDQRIAICNFLDELTSGKYTEDEIESTWRQAGAEIRISRGVPGDATKFLVMLRSALNN